MVSALLTHERRIKKVWVKAKKLENERRHRDATQGDNKDMSAHDTRTKR